MSIDTGERTESAETETVLDVTDEARDKVLDIRAAEDDSETLGLRVEVTGANGVDYTYDLSFETLADAALDDDVSDFGGLPVMIPAASVDQLRGSTLDLPSNPAQGGLVIRNPNRPNPLDGSDIELTGTLAEKVQQLLDGHINPSLASHGGYAELVGVDGTVATITMGGGCQGCAMSAATLRQGITVMIQDAIPEITEIVDTTDHTAGDNPYF